MYKHTKESDFKYLDEASQSLLEALRMDEAKPDFDEQFRSRDVGHHRYFVNPYKMPTDNWGPALDVKRFIPLPSRIQDALGKQNVASFMGVLPEINRTWISIDNKIYFWNYLNPRDIDFYDGLSEVIVSVSLSAPKPGVFIDSIKYLIVIATTVEVVLLAVSLDQSDNIKVIPTAYNISSDSVTMYKVIGTQSGRIFMAGHDGNLYELDYDNPENKWATMLGLEGTSHKCQKINHNAWSWKTLLLPPFIRSMVGVDESLNDLVVDDARRLLYGITSRHYIRVVYMGSDNRATSLIVRSFGLIEECKQYLSAVGRNVETLPRADFFSNSDSVTIAGAFVVSVTESKKVHLMVLLQSGMRIYLRLLVKYFDRHDYIPFEPSDKPFSSAQMEVAFIRGPPPAPAIHCSRAEESMSFGAENGYLPVSIDSTENRMHITTAFYAHGLLLAAVEREREAAKPDELLGVCEDGITRNLPLSQATYRTGQSECLRESVCVVSSPDGRSVINSKIYDIKESCRFIHSPQLASMRSLYYSSQTPVSGMLTDSYVHSQITATAAMASKDKASVLPPECAASHSPAILPLGAQMGSGLNQPDVSHVVPLGEKTTQVMMASSQRQLLCMTRFGLCVLGKNRPIDYLVKFLMGGNFDDAAYTQRIHYFFMQYGAVQSSAMCLEIFCGLPHDLLGGIDGDAEAVGLVMGVADKRSLKDRALRALRRFGGGASFEQIGVGGATITNTPGGGVAGTPGRDIRHTPGVMAPNVNFSYSYVHDASQLVAARLLRAIWLRPIVEKGRLAQIWTPFLLSTIRSGIDQLKGFLNDYYSSAVRGDPRSRKQDASDVEVSDDVYTSGGMLTKKIYRLQTHMYQDADKLHQHIAEERENVSINGLCRLITRSSQALLLMEMLISVNMVSKIPISWGCVSGISFRSLVVTNSAHEKMKRLINDLISFSTKTTETRVSQVANDITVRMTDECYLYFSAGDRYAYEASKLAEAIHKLLKTPNTPVKTIDSQADRLAFLLLKASHYWRSLEDVRDSGEEPSELSNYCRMLSNLGDIGRRGIVQLCLAVAENFDAPKMSNRVLSGGLVVTRDSESIAMSSGSSWDRSLYHTASALNEDQKLEGKEACYRCLLKHIQKLLEHGGSAGTVLSDSMLVSLRAMISDSLDGSSDPVFRQMLFKMLLEKAVDELIRLRFRDVEDFVLLQDSAYKHELLYRYYEFHGMYREAANHMYFLAHFDGDMSIHDRTKFLQQAVSSATRACEFSTAPTSNGVVAANGLSTTSYADFLREVQDELAVAGFQYEAFEALRTELDALRDEMQQSPNTVDRNMLTSCEEATAKLQLQLVSISELFNDICLPFKLWELALCLIHYSGLEAPDAAKKLWRSLIYRKIPTYASTTDGAQFLKLKREADSIFYDQRHQCREGSFENTATWLDGLESVIVMLGKKVYGPDGSAAFPADRVLEEMEEVAAALTTSGYPVGKGWAATLCLQLSLSHVLITQHYMKMLDDWAGMRPDKITQLLSSISFVLLKWTEMAFVLDRSNETERVQLIQTIRAGYFGAWLDKLNRQVNLMRSSRLAEMSDSRLSETMEVIAKVRRLVAELTIS